jgi:sigma-B regulation protein RsbU (phosphoserine phosphatase)
MSESALPAGSATSFNWRSLESFSPREWGTGSLAKQILEQLRSQTGSEAAGVYSVSDDGRWRHVACVGSDTLPVEFDRRPTDGVQTRDLSGGLALVLVHPRQEADLLESVGLLLSASSHLRMLNEQLKEQSFQENLKVVKLEALYDVGLSIASTLDLEPLTEEILMHAVALLDARRGALYLLENGELRCRQAIGGNALPAIGVEEFEREDGEGETSLLPGARHLLVLPIGHEGQARGLLAVADKESRRGVGPFSEEDRRSLSLFASQAAIALENARLHREALEKERLEREMELAADIQRDLLPSDLPELAGWELLGWNRPTRQVGGDYYGAFDFGGGRTGLVVADVTGKGMPAALLVSTLSSALKLLLDSTDSEEELLARLNQHILESSGANKFITLIAVVVEPKGERLGFLNAGHNPGLVVRSDSSIEELLPSGVPLGLLPGTKYEYESTAIAPGDLVCLFSDGITECESEDDEQFGEERLARFLAERRGAPLPRILSELDAAVTDFAGDRPQGDDQTVVLIRRRGDD